MNGFLSVLKPPGMSSHAVVQEIRRLVGIKKVGHAGTLDPSASGVLPVAIGRATRLLEFFEDRNKTYRAEMLLGITTSTQDLEGEVLDCQTILELSPAQVVRALNHFVGGYDQIPPMYSALHYQGKRLYELARAGVQVERAPRRVEISRLSLLRLKQDGGYWRLLLDIDCSTGTYIRTLCVDIGQRLGYGGCLAFLVRTAVGPFSLGTSVTLEELHDVAREGLLKEALLPMDFPLAHLPAVTVDDTAAGRISHGNPPPETAVTWGGEGKPDPGRTVRLYDSSGSLLAIALVNEYSSLILSKVVV